MAASKGAWYAALATAVVWGLKALAIWEAGGLNKTRLEDVGWTVGTLLFIATWAVLGVTFATARPIWLRVLAAGAGIVVGLLLFMVLDGAADALPDSTGWVQEEAGLWAAALVTLAVAWRQRRAT